MASNFLPSPQLLQSIANPTPQPSFLAQLGQVTALQSQRLQVLQEQRALEAQQALNAAYQGAITTGVDGVPQFDQQKISDVLTKQGRGDLIPGTMKTLADANKSWADLAKTKTETTKAQQEMQIAQADALGVSALGVQDHAYSPGAAANVIAMAREHGLMTPQAANQMMQQIQQDPNSVKPIIDQLISASPKAQDILTKRQEAAAKSTEAETAQKREAREQRLADIQMPGFQQDVLDKQVRGAALPLAQAAGRGQYAQAFAALPRAVQARFQNLGSNPKPADILNAALTPAETVTARQKAEELAQGRERIAIEAGRFGTERETQRYAETGIPNMNLMTGGGIPGGGASAPQQPGPVVAGATPTAPPLRAQIPAAASLGMATPSPEIASRTPSARLADAPNLPGWKVSANGTPIPPLAQGIADYTLDPTRINVDFSKQPQLYYQVKQANPAWDDAVWQERFKTMKDLAPSGPLGQQNASYRMLVRHYDDLFQAGQALKNGQIPAYNALTNKIATEFGLSGPTNFDTIREYVSGETVKAIRGSGGTEADIKQARDNFNKAQSPQQLAGAIESSLGIVGAKAKVNNDQIREAINDPTFSVLGPEEKAIMAKHGFDPETWKKVPQGQSKGGYAANAGAATLGRPYVDYSPSRKLYRWTTDGGKTWQTGTQRP